MEDKKVILKEFAQWVDDQIDFKELIGGFGGSVIERIDGALFSFAIDYGYKLTPDEYKETLLQMMDAVILGDIDKIADGVIENVVSHVATGFGDNKEAIVLGGIWDIIYRLIKER